MGSTQFVLTLPSDLSMVEAAVGYLVDRCRAYSFYGQRLDLNFRVSVTEALANAVLYGNGNDPDRTVRVDVTLSQERVVVGVSDEGEGFDPTQVPDPTRPENLQRTGGRGLFLIRSLMDEMEYNDRGNSLRMVLDRETSSGQPGESQ